jgi:hypothetical protein
MQRPGRDGFHGRGSDADADASGDRLTDAVADPGVFGDAGSLSDGDRIANAVTNAVTNAIADPGLDAFADAIAVIDPDH